MRASSWRASPSLPSLRPRPLQASRAVPSCWSWPLRRCSSISACRSCASPCQRSGRSWNSGKRRSPSLTGVANRRAFFDLGARLLARTIADRRQAALLLFDLDRFKEVNDTAGHEAGDALLRAFARLVAGSVRRGDLFSRVGGEEFACLVPNVSMEEALQIAERLRAAFGLMRFPGVAACATVSVGIAMTTSACRTLPALMATADRALYRAKAEGRNRVAPAPLVMLENSANTVRPALDIGAAAPLAAPLAS